MVMIWEAHWCLPIVLCTVHDIHCIIIELRGSGLLEVVLICRQEMRKHVSSHRNQYSGSFFSKKINAMAMNCEAHWCLSIAVCLLYAINCITGEIWSGLIEIFHISWREMRKHVSSHWKEHSGSFFCQKICDDAMVMIWEAHSWFPITLWSLHGIHCIRRGVWFGLTSLYYICRREWRNHVSLLLWVQFLL